MKANKPYEDCFYITILNSQQSIEKKDLEAFFGKHPKIFTTNLSIKILGFTIKECFFGPKFRNGQKVPNSKFVYLKLKSKKDEEAAIGKNGKRFMMV